VRIFQPPRSLRNLWKRSRTTQPVRGGLETILVVEDHPGLRELAFETITNLGYKVILASDGEQALHEFETRRDQIDLLLLEVVLPKLSGPHIYSRICAIKPDVLVIFATGYSADMASLQKELQKDCRYCKNPILPATWRGRFAIRWINPAFQLRPRSLITRLSPPPFITISVDTISSLVVFQN